MSIPLILADTQPANVLPSRDIVGQSPYLSKMQLRASHHVESYHCVTRMVHQKQLHACRITRPDPLRSADLLPAQRLGFTAFRLWLNSQIMRVTGLSVLDNKTAHVHAAPGPATTYRIKSSVLRQTLEPAKAHLIGDPLTWRLRFG